jgi:hypothetical protein
MEMPVIKSCDVTECAYNQKNECHALAITVGDSRGPMCDTFWRMDTKGGDPAQTGHVGACHMSQCMFNMDLECQAGGITVAKKGNEPDCITFKAR